MKQVAWMELAESGASWLRLRFFGYEERWSMAFYIYSNDKYEPSRLELTKRKRMATAKD